MWFSVKQAFVGRDEKRALDPQKRLRVRLLRVRITLYPYVNKQYVTISTKQLGVNKRKQ